MSRRTMADRKRRAADRKTRRESLLVTLARLDRGVITNAERPLLREAVEAEIIESDDLRSTIDGLQRALQAALRRAEAAEEAIVEAETDRDEQRGNYLSACATIAAMHEAAVGEVTGPARGVVEDVADVRAAIERVKALAAMLRSESHPFGMHHHFAERIEQAVSGKAPTTHPFTPSVPPADVRGPVEVQLAGEWHDVTEHMRPAASVGIAHPLARAAAAEAELTRSENARDALRRRLTDAEQAARTAIENHQEAERQLAEARATLRATENDLAGARHRLAERREPERPVSLGTPCAHCGHARNHHPCGGPCCTGPVDKPCRCAAFVAPAEEPQP